MSNVLPIHGVEDRPTLNWSVTRRWMELLVRFMYGLIQSPAQSPPASQPSNPHPIKESPLPPEPPVCVALRARAFSASISFFSASVSFSESGRGR